MPTALYKPPPDLLRLRLDLLDVVLALEALGDFRHAAASANHIADRFQEDLRFVFQTRI